MDEVQKKILSRLQNLCARQECCTRDLLSKAQKALAAREGYIAAPDAAQRIVAALVEDGYADDRRYAAAFAREVIHYGLGAGENPYGPIRQGNIGGNGR